MLSTYLNYLQFSFSRTVPFHFGVLLREVRIKLFQTYVLVDAEQSLGLLAPPPRYNITGHFTLELSKGLGILSKSW
jgi:hypothetical protein